MAYSTLPSPTHSSPSQQLKQDLLSQLGTPEKTGERREGEDLTKTLLEHVVKLKMVSLPHSTEENWCISLLLYMYDACTVLYCIIAQNVCEEVCYILYTLSVIHSTCMCMCVLCNRERSCSVTQTV